MVRNRAPCAGMWGQRLSGGTGMGFRVIAVVWVWHGSDYEDGTRADRSRIRITSLSTTSPPPIPRLLISSKPLGEYEPARSCLTGYIQKVVRNLNSPPLLTASRTRVAKLTGTSKGSLQTSLAYRSVICRHSAG